LHAFRLYGIQGCQFCHRAEAFFIFKGIPCQSILSNDDPIVTEGVKAVTGGNNFPVLVANLGDGVEVVKGLNEGEYNRLAEAYLAQRGPATVDPVVSQVNDSGPVSQADGTA